MKLFLDSAEIADWNKIYGVPSVQGVTTNPTLVRQAGKIVSLECYLNLLDNAQTRKIPELMLQLSVEDVAICLDWAHALSERSSTTRLTFKLPCHTTWQPSHKALKNAGFQTLLTVVSNPLQLLWARDEGANYVAPYLSRLEQEGRDIKLFIDAIVKVQNSGGPKMMAASVKTADVLSFLIGSGAYACTAKPAFYVSLIEDAVTLSAMKQFELDSVPARL